MGKSVGSVPTHTKEGYQNGPIVRLAKTFITNMPRGRSKPMLFETIDGIRWVVKYKNNPQGDKVLINEWVASNLAKSLNLPIPECGLIMLSQQLLDINDIFIPNTTTKLDAGLSFGSRYIDDLDANPTNYQMINLINPGVVPGMVVMDTWIDNPDRDEKPGNLNNIVVSPSNLRAKYTLRLIDLGKISSCKWSASELISKINSRELRGHNRLFARLIPSRLSFEAYIVAVESISSEEIEAVVASVPEEWNLSKDEAIALIDFLNQRKMLVRQIIESRFS